MCRIFYFFSLIILFYSKNLSSLILEAPNLALVECEIQKLDENALVVLDVDYTLIVPDDLILGPCGEAFFQEYVRKALLTPDLIELLGSKISLQSKVSLVDEKILDILNQLKQRKIKTIALTAIPTGVWGLIPNVEEWRVKQVAALGIDFGWSFPSLDSFYFEGFSGKRSSPVFKEGILGTAKYPKGEVLIAFLQKIDFKPSKIIFVDDRMVYIQSVETELQKAGIPSISFYYTAAFNRLCRLDHAVAQFQLDHLFQKKEWLSDQEAHKIVHAIND